MDRATFLGEMESRKGQFAAATWETKVSTAAAYKGHDVRKCVRAIVRCGIAYANLAQNADVETGALPWGEWDVYPLVIVHKGVDYFRLYLSEGSPMTVTYTIDGQPATRADVESMMTPSALRKTQDGPVLTLSIRGDNLLSIAGA